MTDSLYGEPLAQSGSARTATTPASGAGGAWGPTATTSEQHTQSAASDDVSPLTAAIEASSWSREDVELGLHAARTVLLAAAFYYGLKA